MVLLVRVPESNGGLDLDAAARGEVACDSPWEVARRLQLGGGVCLWLSESSRSAGPNAEQKAFLRSTRCTVGPFALEQADAVRDWLHEGAVQVWIGDPLCASSSSVPRATALSTIGPQNASSF